MKRRNILALLLALVLLLEAGPAARAASRTELTWENARKAGSIYLDLNHLEDNVYGIQLELTLAGNYPDCVFTPDSESAYSPGCTIDARREQTAVTIYLTDTEPLNSRDNMTLGTLDLGTKEEVKSSVLPSNVQLILLDRDLHDSSMRISVTGTGRNNSSSGENNRNDRDDRDDQNDRRDPVNNGNNSPNAEPSLPDTSPVRPLFTDVQEKDWFYDAVQFVYNRNMMNGTSSTAFAPYATTTRGMIVTILHRLEGAPAAPAAAFADVPAQEYYAAPVAWASANGIVNGYSNTEFQPNTPITREQMAAILYRYAQYKRADVSQRNDLLLFSDRGKVSPYAVDAVAWTVGAGLITGIDGQLEPAGSANRAQVAVILMRLCENVLK